MGLFKWSQYLKILLFAICAIVVLDITNHKTFKDSKTGIFFREQGLLQHLESSLTTFRKYCQDVYWWTKQNGPVYIARARRTFVPFLMMVKDGLISLALGIWNNVKLLYQYVVDKMPLLNQWVNSHSPGLTNSVYHWTVQIWHLIAECAQMVVILIVKSLQSMKDLFVYVYTTQVLVVL